MDDLLVEKRHELPLDHRLTFALNLTSFLLSRRLWSVRCALYAPKMQKCLRRWCVWTRVDVKAHRQIHSRKAPHGKLVDNLMHEIPTCSVLGVHLRKSGPSNTRDRAVDVRSTFRPLICCGFRVRLLAMVRRNAPIVPG